MWRCAITVVFTTPHTDSRPSRVVTKVINAAAPRRRQGQKKTKPSSRARGGAAARRPGAGLRKTPHSHVYPPPPSNKTTSKDSLPEDPRPASGSPCVQQQPRARVEAIDSDRPRAALATSSGACEPGLQPPRRGSGSASGPDLGRQAAWLAVRWPTAAAPSPPTATPSPPWHRRPRRLHHIALCAPLQGAGPR